MATLVRDIMTPVNKLGFLTPCDTVQKAIDTMEAKNIHCVLISRASGIYGIRIFSYYIDLPKFWRSGEDPKRAKLDVYASSIYEVAEPNWTCQELKLNMNSDHMIVEDNIGNLLGLVSVKDVQDKC